MFALIMATVSTSLLSVIMRLSSGKVKDSLGMLAMNYIVCSALAAAFCDGNQIIPTSHVPLTIGFGVVNGILYLMGFVLMQMNTSKNGVVLSSIFQKLGLLVTLVISVVFYQEIPDLKQSAGFLLALAAIFLMNYQKGGSGAGSGIWLIAMLLTCGMANSMSKIFLESPAAEQESRFLFFTFFVALILCFTLMLLKKQRIGKWECIYGSVIAVPNFFASKFLLGALESISAVIVYPVFNVGSILLVTLMGVLMFRERLARKQWIGVAVILMALVLLNM